MFQIRWRRHPIIDSDRTASHEAKSSRSARTFAPVTSGTGKGLLARAIFEIAFDWQPAAITGGHDPEEREKRLSSVLIEALPGILLDNLNSKALSSDTLASAVTERPAMVRMFGSLKNIPLFSAAFICITGNGLSTSEDLMRRMLLGELDAGCANRA